MNRRFQHNVWLYIAIYAMSRKSPQFLNYDALCPLSRLGIKIPSEAELEVSKAFLMDHVLIARTNDSNVVVWKLYQQKLAFPNVYKLPAAVSTFGCSTAVCESSFSTLARIDSPHRRSMTHTRQRNLVLLAFEKSRTSGIELDELVVRFGRKHTRLHLL